MFLVFGKYKKFFKNLLYENTIFILNFEHILKVVRFDKDMLSSLILIYYR